MEKKTVAVILAAGQGKRMGTKTAKQFLELNGKPVLYYSLQAFEESAVDYMLLVTSEQEMEYCKKEIVEKYKFQKVIGMTTGGKERYHSVYQGIKAAGEIITSMGYIIDVVLIHDGARPFVTKEMIAHLMEETKIHEACVSATPVKDTIKIADEEGFCDHTPNRNRVWAVQTPQVFLYEIARHAYEQLIEKEDQLLAKGIQITDDAMVVETILKKKVKLVEGDYRNIKLTTPEDLLVAQAFFK